jgi:hypothetical protein
VPIGSVDPVPQQTRDYPDRDAHLDRAFRIAPQHFVRRAFMLRGLREIALDRSVDLAGRSVHRERLLDSHVMSISRSVRGHAAASVGPRWPRFALQG